jgi:protein CpxP
MKKSIKTLLIATAIAGGVAASMAYAVPPGAGEGCAYGPQSMGMGPGMGMGMGFGRHGMDSDSRIDRMAGMLDLSKEQRDKVRAIVDKARPQTRALRDKLSENHTLMHALMQQDTVKEADIRKLADNQGKLIADMIVQRSKMRNEIHAVLTPEQREKLQQRMQNRGVWHRGGFSSTEPADRGEAGS